MLLMQHGYDWRSSFLYTLETKIDIIPFRFHEECILKVSINTKSSTLVMPFLSVMHTITINITFYKHISSENNNCFRIHQTMFYRHELSHSLCLHDRTKRTEARERCLLLLGLCFVYTKHRNGRKKWLTNAQQKYMMEGRDVRCMCKLTSI